VQALHEDTWAAYFRVKPYVNIDFSFFRLRKAPKILLVLGWDNIFHWLCSYAYFATKIRIYNL
jgi:hypothetical protein